MVVLSTVNGHVSWKCVPIQRQPSQRPHSAASTASSSATRVSASFRAGGRALSTAMRGAYHSRVAPMQLEPGRTVAELRELQELTGDGNGAQRVAWTDTWEQAREWLRGKVAGTNAQEEIDAAGNQWFTLRGSSERELLIGGHIDSVPNGGWLDGCLNVMAGVEVLRRIAADGEPPLTLPPSTGPASGARNSPMQLPISSCTSSRGRSWSRWISRSASCSARSASNATW